MIYRVLYVDDEPDLLEIGKLFLEGSAEFSVDTETQARCALTRIGTNEYDAIISDYQMPGMDGITFLKEVRTRAGDIPFILFTGRGREEVVIQALNNGADFYLQKGGDPTSQFAELGHKIRQAVGRKAAEKALAESEARFRTLFEKSKDAMLILDNNRFIDCNAAALSLLGMGSKEQLRGLHPSETSPEKQHDGRDSYEKAEEMMATALREGSHQFEWVHKRANGELWWDEISLTVIPIGGRQIIHTAWRDITGRKKAEEELRAAYEQITASEEELRSQLDEVVAAQKERDRTETNFRTLVNNAPDAIYIQTGNRFRYLNNAALRLLGASSSEELLGKDTFDRIHPSFHERIRERVKNLTVDLQPVELLDEIYVRLDGTPVDVEVTAMPFQFQGEHGALVMVRDITGRKKAEEELRAAYGQITASEEELRSQLDEIITTQKEKALTEENFRNLVDNAPDAIFIATVDRRFRYVNNALLRLLGAASAEDLLGLSTFDIIHPSLHENIRQRIHDLTVDLKPATLQDEIYVRLDGTAVDVEVVAVPFQYRGEHAVLVMVRDITERKRAETELREAYERIAAAEEELRGQYAELRKSEERYRRLTDKLPIPVCVADENDVITYINDRFTVLFGYTHDDIPTLKEWWELAYPDEEYRNEVLTTWKGAVDAALENGSDIRPVVYRVTCRDSTVRDVEISGIPFEKSFLATFIDMTGRLRAGDDQRESGERLRTLLQTVPSIAIQGYNLDGTTQYWNEASEKLYGYTAREAIGKNLLDLIIPAGMKDHVRQTIVQMKETGKPIPASELTLRRKDGTPVATYSHHALVKKSDGDLELFCIDIDLTERKRAEEALRQANKKLNLLSGITRHDIGNQLLVLRAYLHMMEKQETAPELLEFIRKGEDAAEAIHWQIDFMRNYQDIGAQAPKWQTVSDIIEEAWRHLNPPGMTLRNDSGRLEIFADPLIGKVFYNLMENSQRHGVHATNIGISLSVSGTELVISYRDNGAGISATDKQELFQKGFGKHTGLGLFLSREILAITGITIHECGEPGKGVQFEITVPEGGFRNIPG